MTLRDRFIPHPPPIRVSEDMKALAAQVMNNHNRRGSIAGREGSKKALITKLRNREEEKADRR